MEQAEIEFAPVTKESANPVEELIKPSPGEDLIERIKKEDILKKEEKEEKSNYVPLIIRDGVEVVDVKAIPKKKTDKFGIPETGERLTWDKI